jgi:hypothetical protein
MTQKPRIPIEDLFVHNQHKSEKIFNFIMSTEFSGLFCIVFNFESNSFLSIDITCLKEDN